MGGKCSDRDGFPIGSRHPGTERNGIMIKKFIKTIIKITKKKGYKNHQQVGKVDIIMKYYPKSKVTNITLPEEMLNYSLLLNDSNNTTSVVEKTKSVFFQIFIIVVIVGITLLLLFYLKINNARKRRRRAYRSRRKRSRITFDDKDLKL